MDYLTFREYIQLEVLKYLPEQYAGYKIKVITVVEHYKDRDVLKIVPPVHRTGKMEAGIYLESLYEHYLKGIVLKSTLEKAAACLTDALRYNENISKDAIVMTVADTERIKEYLNDYPHRPFHGLTLLYQMYVEPEKKDYYSCIITKDMMEYLGLSEQELYENALKNTKSLFPPIIQTIGESVYEMITKSSIDAEIRDNMPESLKADDSMYVIGNKKGMNGAVYLVYKDVIGKLAERAGTDFYLMPSTIYDLYAVPVKKDSSVDMSLIYNESQAGGMRSEEKLCEHIYYYDYERKELKQFK